MFEYLLDKDFFISKEQTVAFEPRSPQLSYPEHTHNFSEIVIVSSGTGKHILNDHYFDLSSGMMFYVKASDHHMYDDVDNLHLTNILFRHPSYFKFINGINQLLPSDQDSESHFFIDQKYHHLVNNILNKFSQLSHHKNQHQIEYESLFLQLLLTLKDNQYVEKGSGNMDNRVKQLLRWLKLNYAATIDWDQLTQQFSISLRTFHRYLKKNFNTTPQKYLLKCRLVQAHYKLRYTNQTISSIALESGFNDSGYFATCFKKEFTITPTDLRKSIAEQ